MNDRPPKGKIYLCFSEKDDLVSAVSRFFERFAHAPLFVWVEKHMIWMGPCKKKDNNHPLKEKEKHENKSRQILLL